MKNTKTLYLKSFEYNTYLILNELKNKIYENGGFLVSNWQDKQDKIIIYNRTLIKNIEDLKEALQRIENNLKNTIEEERKEKLLKYKEEKEKELKEIENIKHKKIVYNTGYLQFKLNNYIYYIQFNENPFLKHYIHKQPIDQIKENKYILLYNRYIDIFTSDIFNNFDLFSYKLSKKNIKEIVTILYNFMIDHKESEIVYNKNKKYCYNCNGYYYENEKEKRYREYEELKKYD